ncbi:MAG: hypothetical protein JKY25_01910 [Robiginitomaculum sp.]|nr:hypothetical protein [Robiginitomaculum sp.]
MTKLNIAKYLLSGAGLIALSGCSLASLPGGYTPIEKQTVSELDTANYIPRSADDRAAILTQDLFAQAAFWSREYDLNPADLEAAINLANTLRRLDNPYKAIEVAQTTRALYPRDVDLIAELAAAYIASNKPKEALPILDNALGQRPNMARLWSLKGAALDQFEQFAQARQHYSKALALAPNDPGVIANVGLSYALEGDPKTAEVWLRRAATMPGASPSVRQNLSLVLGLQNKFGEAETWASRDLDKEATANNMSYIRQLRGASSPVVNTGRSDTPRTYAPKPYSQQAPNSPALRRQTALAGRTGERAQYQRPPAPPQFKQPGAPAQNVSSYGRSAAPPTKLNVVSDLSARDGGPKTSRDAALAAAKAMSPNSQRGNGQYLRQVQNPTPQNVLGRIAKNNTPKSIIAQQQRQQLVARTQAQYPVQEPAMQAGQYQNGYYANGAYPQQVPPNMSTRPAYRPVQSSARPPAPAQNRQPARSRRR